MLELVGASSAGWGHPVNTAQNVAAQPDTQLLSRHRLTLNEQLDLFTPPNEFSSPAASYGLWAILALALAVIPWVLVGVMVWKLT
jgi:hypothetical protein